MGVITSVCVCVCGHYKGEHVEGIGCRHRRYHCYQCDYERCDCTGFEAA